MLDTSTSPSPVAVAAPEQAGTSTEDRSRAVERLLSAAPPLSLDQIDRLRTLLHGTTQAVGRGT